MDGIVVMRHNDTNGTGRGYETMTRRTMGITALVVGILTATWLALSPYWAMSNLRDSVKAHDVDAINQYVDYETLRTNLKRHLSDQIATETTNRGANPMGAAMAQAFIAPMIDQLIRPEVVNRLFDGEKAGRPAPEITLVGKDASIHRTSPGRFVVRNGDPAKGGVVFELQGTRWRMTDIEIDIMNAIGKGTRS